MSDIRHNKLYELLPQLEERREDQDYWFDLDKALREVINPDTDDKETAFNDLLLTLWQDSKKFTTTANCPESFRQMCGLLSIAFTRKSYRLLRANLQDQINSLNLKQRTTHLSPEELQKLKDLRDFRARL